MLPIYEPTWRLLCSSSLVMTSLTVFLVKTSILPKEELHKSLQVDNSLRASGRSANPLLRPTQSLQGERFLRPRNLRPLLFVYTYIHTKI